MSTTTTTPQTQQAGVKVFVGNLAFKTNQAQLAEVFKSAGKILDANIISRGRRSMGYGFVTFETMSDAQNAVKEMHHKEIDGRQVNVEVARPKQEKPATQNNNNNNNQGGNSNNNNDNNNQGGFRSIRRNTNYRGRGGRGGFNNRGPRTQGGQGQVRQNNNNSNNQGQNNNNNNNGERRPPRRTFRNRNSNNNSNNNNNNQGQNSGKQEQTEPRQPRQPRQPKPQVEKTPSKTTLFVANLPWSVTDETFGQFLTKESIKFKKAFVARRRNGRSLGYGFVEFDTEEEQTKGISSIEKKQIDGRELTAKVALTDLSKMNIVANNNNATTTTTATSNAPATTTTTTTTTPAATTNNAEKK